jgi:hypothetical protein
MVQPKPNERLIIDVDPKEHSVEGHIKKCTLKFNGNIIWGPASCHDNSTKLAEALHSADSRFELVIEDKSHSTEGHIAKISVYRGGHTYLSNHSTHDNMTGLRDAVRKALNEEDGPI